MGWVSMWLLIVGLLVGVTVGDFVPAGDCGGLIRARAGVALM